MSGFFDSLYIFVAANLVDCSFDLAGYGFVFALIFDSGNGVADFIENSVRAAGQPYPEQPLSPGSHRYARPLSFSEEKTGVSSFASSLASSGCSLSSTKSSSVKSVSSKSSSGSFSKSSSSSGASCTAAFFILEIIISSGSSGAGGNCESEKFS